MKSWQSSLLILWAMFICAAGLTEAQISRAEAELKAYPILEQGRRLSRQWQFQPALPHYEKVARDYPNTDAAAEAHWYLGQYHLHALKRPRAALKHFDQAIAFASEECEFGDYAHLDRAKALYTLGEYEQALKQFEEIVDHGVNEEVTRPAASYMALTTMKLRDVRAGRSPTAKLSNNADCGPLALQMLCQTQGIKTSLAQIRKASKVQGKGATLQQLVQGAHQLKLPVQAVRLTLRDLKRAPMPVVLWVLESHFTVVKSVKGDFVTLQEPGQKEQTIHLRDLATFWGGESLILAKGTVPFTKLSQQELASAWGGSHLGTPGGPGSGNNPNGPFQSPPGDDPINMFNGNQMVYPPPDFVWTHTVGPPVVVQRCFNSQLSYGGNYGLNWTNTLDWNLTLDAGQNATILRPDGRQDRFTWTGSDFLPPRAVYDRLIRNGDGTHTLRVKQSKYRYNFNTFGRLASVVDENGNALTMTYQQIGQPGDPGFRLLLTRVRDASGQDTVLTYNASNLCERITDPSGRFVQYTYNAAGRLLTARLPNGDTYTYTYGTNILSRIVSPTGTWNAASGSRPQLMASITDPNNRATSYIYQLGQGFGQYTDALGRVWRMHYDSNGSCTGITDPLGSRSRYFFDGNGNPIRSVDANGSSWQFTHDARGNILSITDPQGKSWQFVYNANDRVTRTTDPLGRQTNMTYDGNGNLLSMTLPTGARWEFTYLANGLLQTLRDPNGNITRFTYNATGEMVQMQDPAGGLTLFTYDARGNAASATDPNGKVHSYEYDALDRLTRVMLPDSAVRLFEYNEHGITSLTDEMGRIRRYFYDGTGHMTRMVNPDGTEVRFEYDAVYNITRLINERGIATRYVYDNANRMIETNFAHGTPAQINERFGYDKAGNLVWREDGLGVRSTFKYDSLNRLITYTAPDYWAVYNYDPLGNLTQVQDPTGKSKMTYDAENRMLTYTAPSLELVRYAYDAAGNTTSIATRLGTTRYNYDVMNRLTRAVTPQGVFTFRYDPGNNLIEQTSPFHRALHTYDMRDRLASSFFLRANGTTLGTAGYAYDPAGNLIRSTIFDGTTTRRNYYVYDAKDRLTQETSTGDVNPFDIRYTYDAIGNRLTETDLNTSQTTSYLYDEANRLLSAGSVSYSYDANGRLLTKTDASGTTQFTWDARHQLTRVQIPNVGQARYFYDGLGNRVRREGAGGAFNYVFDPLSDVPTVLMALGSSSQYFPSAPQGGTLNTPQGAFLYDQVGNALAQINASTATWGAMSAWGEGIGTGALQPRGFSAQAGAWRDATTGLVMMGLRWYDPAVGRFLSMDPIRYRGGDTNLYGYVQNNPLAFVDPWGLDAWDWVHGGLDALGLIPGLGEIADGVNAGLYALRGKWGLAALSAAAMIPVVGSFATGAKHARKAIVIGESMGRVKDATRALQRAGVDARWYQAWKMNPFDFNTAMRRNEAWIKRKMREGYDIYDIGLDPSRVNRSPFYDMERRMINDRGYPTNTFPWP
ncbi:MAG: hypothetical protein KIT45_03835 [Fimbriimonadia bacterium]|nr:hypothetical protein [Fimbriimonadia bacterium]